MVQEQETALRVELCAARQEAVGLREELAAAVVNPHPQVPNRGSGSQGEGAAHSSLAVLGDSASLSA